MSEIDIVERFNTSKKALAGLQEEKARIDGKKEQKLAELVDKFGVSNVEEAQELVKTMGDDLDKHEALLKTSVTELEQIVAGAKS